MTQPTTPPRTAPVTNPTPDPAERRHIIRGAIECAIGLNPAIPNRQAAPLTASVWRIVEPALAHRDRQIAAVRDVLDGMDGVTGARFWAQQLHAALGTRPGGLPPIAWCGASMPGAGCAPIGPCVLRAGHDGPVHQAADGAKWWPTDGGVVTAPESMTEQEVQAFRQAWAARQSQSISVINRTPPMRISTELVDEATADGAGLYEAVVAMFGGPLPGYVPPPKDACPCGGTKTLHAPDCPIHPVRIRAIEERLTALLPEEARAAGLHFAYDTTPDRCRAEDNQPGFPPARCDLPAGHPEHHRDQTIAGAFRWDDSLATYPTTTPED